jgi:hypothetical protein
MMRVFLAGGTGVIGRHLTVRDEGWDIAEGPGADLASVHAHRLH